MLNYWRKASIALALPLVLAAAGTGCAPNPASSEGSTAPPPQEESSPPERTASKNVKVAAPLPSRDAPGKDIPDLPRYPDSVRVEYERSQLDALILTRMRYLSDEELDTVRGFYRGVFQSEDWRVANAEFSDGEWTFLAVKGDREAAIEVRPHDAGVETDVRLSEPAPPTQPEEDSSEAPPPERDKSRQKAAPARAPAPAPSVPATAPATATATAPATVPPATVPPASGGYGYDDDDGGEYEDDD